MARRAVVSTVALVGLAGRAAGDCSCIYQGQDLSSDLYTKYPDNDVGKYKDVANIAKYGTMCAAWDQVPGTPWFDSCKGVTDFSGDKNWCQIPWCYVASSCSSKVASSVFKGSSTAFYSYAACGGAPDCFTDGGKGVTGCPYDPAGEKDYELHKKACPCTYQGQALPSALYTDYPEDNKGAYKDNKNIQIYGTTCAAWDQSPSTPWHSSCPKGADWCAYDYNWCQLPWCYVSSTCSTKIASSVFKGSDTAHYSYDTCLSTPDCYSNSAKDKRANLPKSCPYDKNDANWYTAKVCDAWSSGSSGSSGSSSNETDSAAGMAISGAAVLASAAACSMA